MQMTNRACLAGIAVGDGVDVAVMGALNVSPESFYRGSIAAHDDELLRAAEAMVSAGAAFLDVGAMSTAPYMEGTVSASEEAERLGRAVERLVKRLEVPVSADTSRHAPARAALEAGARIINDVSGLTVDERTAAEVARTGAGLILMATEREERGSLDPVALVKQMLGRSLAIARDAGIDPSRIVVDPGIGFFRRQGMAWHEWDCHLLARLEELRDLGRPICVGVSRKSFIGAIAAEPDPARRLPGSLSSTAAAVLHGAQLVRAHDVEETVQAVKVAQAIRRARSER
jgi:dihydropteroate synthase